ncbi:porin family protein [Chitinophaga sp. SYP-B3965]|uniref:porin family protein n=1 Tax=Chitinophaga sp. SYP-B3965 TaxID=2663120 RepID=UPI00156705DF|nr:porin family protein [Chitinophaga sp. SYP-B3965]
MRIIFLSLLIVCTLPVCAQISVGVVGGYSSTALRISDREQFGDIGGPASTPSEKSLFDPKWHAGLIADIHLVKGFYLQPRLLLSRKGDEKEYRVGANGFYHITNDKTNLTYLELPLNLLYKKSLGRGKLAVGAGPYFAKALSGKYSTHRSSRDENAATLIITEYRDQGKIEITNKQPALIPSPQYAPFYYKPYDAGLNFIAGYECKNGLLFNVNYSLGLADVYTYSPEKRRNRYFGLSAGYLFKL